VWRLWCFIRGTDEQKIRTRIAEHRIHIRYNTSGRSVITEHRRQLDHEFQWDEVVILDEEPCYRRRLVSEMLNIKKQKNGLNLQTDTDGLHKAYIPIINKVWLSDANSLFPLSVCFDPHYWAYIVAGVRCLSSFTHLRSFFRDIFRKFFVHFGHTRLFFFTRFLVSFEYYFLLLFLLDFRYVNSFTRRSFCVQFFWSFFFLSTRALPRFSIHLTVQSYRNNVELYIKTHPNCEWYEYVIIYDNCCCSAIFALC